MDTIVGIKPLQSRGTHFRVAVNRTYVGTVDHGSAGRWFRFYAVGIDAIRESMLARRCRCRRASLLLLALHGCRASSHSVAESGSGIPGCRWWLGSSRGCACGSAVCPSRTYLSPLSAARLAAIVAPVATPLRLIIVRLPPSPT